MTSYISQSRRNKPAQDLIHIMDAISEYAVIRKGAKNKQIHLNVHGVQHCFVLFEGDCLIIRDNDHRTISTCEAPIILGLARTQQDENIFFIRAFSAISYALIPVKKLESIIENKNLWKEYSTLLHWLLSAYHQYIKTIVSGDNYYVACQLLKELIHEKDIVRMSVTAATYIQDRTLLSRSWVMHLLSELKMGGFIEIHRGHLVKINKLPPKF